MINALMPDNPGRGEVNLHELDANEWYDVWRQFRPDGTREEYERDWAEFQEFKAAWKARKELQ